ncbi:helix-turn-helix domain-containing protein [Anaerotruncus rubiinfantis]|uniref:helix-turn-helix domain-containing protein n=1 Tax=Anaerotruncus rubiinfantis TaxID=1720200 RepID=UPI00164DBBA9|nr:helix-turn-helix transcriptional regulator [Anaerotruncus rubiinfantis]
MGKEEIAKRIKNARVAAGFTQSDAAKRLGISYQAVSNYERGINRIDSDTLNKLCNIYSVSINSILSPESEVPPSASTENDELQEYLEYLKSREDGRMLFSLAKNATKEDVMRAIAIIEALTKKEERQE